MTIMVTAEQAKNMRSGVDIEGTVERKGEPRNVSMKSGGTIDVCDAYLVDETGGDIKLTLWGEDVERIKDGAKIKITNGYTNSFKGDISITKGKFGKLDVLE